jgi:ParB family chromosome partitioning protein
MKQRRLPPEVPTTSFRASTEIDKHIPESVDCQDVMDQPDPQTVTPELEGAAIQHDIRDIAVELIDENPFAPREVYTPQMILARAEELRSQGQHDNIHVIPHPENPKRFMIGDGWTRTRSCREHKVFPTLRAEVHHDLTPMEAAWFGYESNEGREQHCDLDRALFYDKQIRAGMSPAEVARRANLSKTMMTYFKAYSRLPEDILEIIRGHPEKFGSLVAYNLAKLFDKAGVRKAVSLAARYADEDQTVRWLIDQVQSILNPKERAPVVAPVKHIRFSNGYYKQSEKGFELSIDVPEEKRERFAAALESLVNSVAISEETGHLASDDTTGR